MANEQTQRLLPASGSRRKLVKHGFLHSAKVLVDVTAGMGSLVVCSSMILFVIIRLALYGIFDVAGLTCLGLMVFLSVIPLFTPRWAERFVQSACDSAKEYFPLDVILDDPDAWKTGGPYMVGLEPHSALPICLPPVFAPGSTLCPKQLQPCHSFASSVCFTAPIVRHMYHWMGIRPVSRKNISHHLGRGNTVVLVPGGVREILHMAHGKEVAFLSRRTGFVKLALQHGAPLVPAFAFGQTDTYHWYKPGPPWCPQMLISSLSRSVGFVPLIMWGRWGTPVPFKNRMTLVVGRPIIMPKVEEPTQEQVQHYLQRFIEDLKRIFEEHKVAAGYPDMVLEVL